MPTSELRVRLTRHLRGFAEPDTSSQFEGRLEPGTYKVLEQKLGTGVLGEADYARLLAPGLADSDTWICTRWRDQRYAEMFEAPPRAAPTPFDWTDDGFSVPETALVGLLPEFYAFSYTPQNARYPFPIEGVRLRQGPPHRNNCCTFVEALIVKAWQDVHGSRARWSARRHSLMMIMTDDLFGPITAVVGAKMGVELADIDAPPHPWTLIQGWRQANRSGHAFLILDYDAETDRVLTLESNSAHGLNGVGFRKLGNLADQPGERPPEQWWRRREMPTWEDLRSTYVNREMAVLKVTDIGWVRGEAPAG